MNALYNTVTSRACTTDCARYAYGNCPYLHNQKHQCPRWMAFASMYIDLCDECESFSVCRREGWCKSGDAACGMFRRSAIVHDDADLID